MQDFSVYVGWFRQGGETLLEQQSNANAFLLYQSAEVEPPKRLQYKTTSISDLLPLVEGGDLLETLRTQKLTSAMIPQKPLKSLRPSESLVVQPLAKSTRNPFNDQLTIGRANNNDVILKLPSVSKFHAWLKVIDGAYRIFDAKSSFGTFVEGKRVAEDGLEGVILNPGTKLRLGELEMVFFDTNGFIQWLRENNAL
jgi:hypothetical protein